MNTEPYKICVNDGEFEPLLHLIAVNVNKLNGGIANPVIYRATILGDYRDRGEYQTWVLSYECVADSKTHTLKIDFNYFHVVLSLYVAEIDGCNRVKVYSKTIRYDDNTFHVLMSMLSTCGVGTRLKLHNAAEHVSVNRHLKKISTVTEIAESLVSRLAELYKIEFYPCLYIDYPSKNGNIFQSVRIVYMSLLAKTIIQLTIDNNVISFSYKNETSCVSEIFEFDKDLSAIYDTLDGVNFRQFVVDRDNELSDIVHSRKLLSMKFSEFDGSCN